MFLIIVSDRISVKYLKIVSGDYMKHTLMFVLLLSITNLFAKDKFYESCSYDKESALKGLSDTIAIRINNSFERNKKITNIDGKEKISDDVKSKLSKKSGVYLKNVSYYSRDSKSCAKVSESSLILMAKNLLNSLSSKSIKNLPKANKVKVTAIEEIIKDIEILSMYSVIYRNRLSSKKLRRTAKLEKKLRDILDRTYTQFVEFVNGPQNIIIYVDSIKQRKKQAQTIALSPGKHSYEIKSRGYCNYVGEFELGIDETKKMELNLEEWTLPKVLFKLDNLDKFAKAPILKVDGKKHSWGKVWKGTTGHCDNEIVYQEIDAEKIDSSKIYLKPGLNKTITKTHISEKYISDKLQLVNNLLDDNSSLINLKYQFAIPESDYSNSNNAHEFEVDLLKIRRAILHGPGIRFGTSSSSKRYEFNYSLYLNLSEIDGKPLLLGKRLPVVPYGGVQLGIGYLHYDNNPMNDDNVFLSEIFTTRLVGGFLFPINSNIAIDLSGQKLITLDRAWSFGGGIFIRL
jgi:hypothetical protein